MAHADLFPEHLSPDAFLTRFTYSAFETYHRFCAYHALLFAVAHDVIVLIKQSLAKRAVRKTPLGNHFDLRRTFENQLQPVLRMVLDFALYFDFFSFEGFGRKLAVLKEFHSGREDDGG
jgi:hypothetical protein